MMNDREAMLDVGYQRPSYEEDFWLKKRARECIISGCNNTELYRRCFCAEHLKELRKRPD